MTATNIIPKIESWLERVVTSQVEVASRTLVWPRPAKRILVMIGDALLALLAVTLAFSLRLGEWQLLDTWAVLRFSLSLLVVWFPVAMYLGVYNSIFRYTGRGAIVRLAVALFFTAVPLLIFYTITSYPGVPRSIAIIASLVFLMLIATARIIGRYVLVDLFHARQLAGTRLRRVLIYGAGTVGQRLAASLQSESGMRLVGYIDDDLTKRHHRLDGFKVHHTGSLASVIEQTGATDVLLAMSGITRQRRREIINTLSEHSVEVRTLPPIREVMEGRITISDLRSIEVEDLLGRSAVAPDAVLLARSVEGKRVLVTGAGGSIGSELCRQALTLGPSELILAEANEFALFVIAEEIERLAERLDPKRRPRIVARLINVTQREVVERLFVEFAPQTIFHAAAYKHVPLVEANVVAGIENNLFGTMNCAIAARQTGVERFILISTDKAVRPPNVMGASKRACELVLQALDREGSETIFAMVRFGNVLGSSGSVVPLFKRQIAEGGPVTVTHRDVTRYFMTIPEASQLVIQAAGLAEGGEVFVLDMGEPVRIWDLARTMVRLAGLTIREPGSEVGDIEVEERGLRPGEKLYEELLIGDDPQPTPHPRIMRAREQCLTMDQLRPRLAALRRGIDAGDALACRENLRKLVPTLAAAQRGTDALRVELQRTPPARCAIAANGVS